MKNRKFEVSVLVLVISAFLVAGCETMGGSAGLGGLIGAGTGAIIGNQSGHAGEGALIGGVVGALAGVIVHDVKTRQMRTAQETAQEYNYNPSQGFRMDVKGGSVAPGNVRPGGEVTSTMQYAVLGTGPGVTVAEKAELKQNGQTLKTLASRNIDRTDGTWENTIRFNMPDKAPAGEYLLAQQISAQGQTFSRDTAFTVATTTAGTKVTVGGTVEMRMAAIH